jgi:hypothetical protein
MNQHFSGIRLCTFGLLIVAGLAMGQTTAPVGITKPAEYDCSGIEGVALSNCKKLNARAARCAVLQNNASSNAAYDCAGMTGAALAACLDLNAPEVPVPSSDIDGAAGRPIASRDLDCRNVDSPAPKSGAIVSK